MIKKFLKYLAIFVAVFLALDVALVLGLGHLHQEPKHADAIIVLGAAINSEVAYERALTGLSEYQKGESNTIVLSGGKIAYPDISEARYMQNVILINTEQKPNIILEQASNNTYQNINNSRAKLPGASTIIIVTDKFHVARSVLLAKRAGFKNVYWASPDESYLPKRALGWYYLREVLAVLGYIPKLVSG